MGKKHVYAAASDQRLLSFFLSAAPGDRARRRLFVRAFFLNLLSVVLFIIR